jgi:hypothetical protein
MNGIAAKVAKEIGVFFEDLNIGRREREGTRAPCRPDLLRRYSNWCARCGMANDQQASRIPPAALAECNSYRNGSVEREEWRGKSGEGRVEREEWRHTGNRREFGTDLKEASG